MAWAMVWPISLLGVGVALFGILRHRWDPLRTAVAFAIGLVTVLQKWWADRRDQSRAMTIRTHPRAAEDPGAAEQRPCLDFEVTRTEATAVALRVELMKIEGKPVPKWMQQIADAV